MEDGAFSPLNLTWLDATVRFAAALLLSLMIGIERFVHNRPVDFRPFVIVSVASCALVVGLLELGHRSVDPQVAIDPAKVISGVMSGIGFLGAGALFKEKHFVQGAGSAASIWAAGAIGIVCGFGFIWIGMIVAAMVVLTLLLGALFVSDYTVTRDPEE